MKVAVHQFVNSCKVCQQSKGNKAQIPLKSLDPPTKPWEEISYNFIVKLPLSNGFDNILVVVDQFSCQAHFMPCNKAINAEQLANIYIKEV